MNETELNKILTDLLLPDEDTLRKEVAVARVIAGIGTSDEKRAVDAWCAEDGALRREIDEGTREMQKLTPARLAWLEEKIRLKGGVQTVPQQETPLPDWKGKRSNALETAVQAFTLRLAAGGELLADMLADTPRLQEESAIVRFKPQANGVEIEITSQNPEDAGASIEVLIEVPSRAAKPSGKIVLKPVLRGLPTVQGRLRLTKQYLVDLPKDAKICLRTAA